MTDWGSYDGHLRVGIDVSMSPSSVSHSTTSVTITVKYYVQSEAWGFQDNQTLILTGGDLGGSYDYFLSLPSNSSASTLIVTRTLTVTPSYTATKSYTFGAKVNYAYNGGAPSNSVNFTVPKRPVAVPDAPGTPSANPTATSVSISWSFPDGNGDDPDYIQVQVDNSSGFGSPLNDHTDNASPSSVSGLTRATTYYTRIRAHNSAGYGSWSGTRSFTTDSTVPGQMSIGTIVPNSAGGTYPWSLPSDSGGETNTYIQIQTSTNSGFTNIVDDHTDSASPAGVGGLDRVTTYYVRARAHNSVGYGAWSATKSYKTLATVPDTQAAAPTISAIDPVSATIAWAAPNNGGDAIDNYTVQVATNSAFTTGLASYTDTASPFALTGLVPGTAYWVRTRANNGVGSGSYSPAATFTTLSGAKVWNGSAWIDVTIQVWNGSAWVIAVVQKYTGSAWSAN